MSNPFTVIFGVEPQSAIPRSEEYHKVISDFEAESPSSMGYVITGVRGCGKTVLMTKIQNYFSKKKDWIVTRLNPDLDLYASAISQLGEHIRLRDELVTGVNASMTGFGGGITARSLSDSETLLRKMLKDAANNRKRVLIAIDEASNTKNIKTFAHSYQAFIGDKLSVYMLMTAVPENFSSLSNSKNGTFLRRLPKIKLQALSDLLVEQKYSEIFSISQPAAIELSKIVNVYPYAFQLLGSILWETKKDKPDEGVLAEFDARLYDGAYRAIWDQFTEKEKDIVCAIAHSDSKTVKDIRDKLNMEPNQFSPYRENLYNNGLINTQTYGKVSFTLPRFSEFVLRMEQYMV